MTNPTKHKVKTVVRTETTDTTLNGVIEQWIDGKLVCTITTKQKNKPAADSSDSMDAS